MICIFVFEVSPTKGTSDCEMECILHQKIFWGVWSGADFIKNVSSVDNSKTKYTTKSNIDGIILEIGQDKDGKGALK